MGERFAVYEWLDKDERLAEGVRLAVSERLAVRVRVTLSGVRVGVAATRSIASA